MAKDFEGKVLKALDNLQKGQDELRADVSGLKKGQDELRTDVNSLQKGQKKLQSDVTSLQDNVGDIRESVTIIKEDLRKVEVQQEVMEGKIDHIAEIGKAQKESWEKSATKEDVYDVESRTKLQSSVIKTHSINLADHERRLKRLETKSSQAA